MRDLFALFSFKTNRKIHYKLTRSTIAILAFLLVIGLLYSINIPLIVAGVVIIHYAIRQLPISIFSSRMSSVLGAFFLYSIFLAVIASIADIFDHDFNIMLAPLFVLVLLAASLELHRIVIRKKSGPPSPYENSKQIDALSVVLAFVVVAFIVTLPFLRYGLNGGILGQINANVDDSVHFAMINDRLHFQQDFYIDNSPETVRAEDKISYPAGWHTANAILINAAAPNISTGTQTLVAYVLSKIFWTVVFVYFLARVTLLKLTQYDKKSITFYFGVGLLLFFTYIAAISQFLFGFYNFIPQLISLLILASLTFNSTPLDKKQDALLIGSIVAIGGGMVWFLLLPVMAAALVAMLFCSFEKRAFHQTFTTIRKSLIAHILIYVALIIAILQQLYIATMSSESISFTESIILTGEVARYSQLLFITLAIGVIAYLFLWNKRKDPDLSPAAWVTAMLMLFTGFVLAVCLIKTQEPRYYYFKVLSAVVVVLIPFCIAGIVKLFYLLQERIESGARLPIAASVLLVLTVSILPSFSSTGNILSYMKGERPTTPSSINSVFKNLQPESAYTDRMVSYKLYYDYRSFPQNFINTMIVKANQPDSKCFRETLGRLIYDNSATSMADTAAKVCGPLRISIVVPEQEHEIIQELFKQRNLPDTVTVVSE